MEISILERLKYFVKSHKKVAFASVVAVAILIFFISFFAYFSTHIYFGVKVSSVDVGAQNTNKARQTLLDQYNNTVITLKYSNEITSAHLSDIGITFDLDEYINKAFDAKRSNKSISKYFSNDEFNVFLDFTLNKSTLESYINSHFTQKIIHSNDINIKYSQTDEKFQVVPPKNVKNTFDENDIFNQLKSLNSRLQSKDVVLKLIKNSNEIPKDEVLKQKNKANKILKLNLSFYDNGELKYFIDPPDIASFVKFETNYDAQTIDIGTDDKAILDFIDNTLAPSLTSHVIDQEEIFDTNTNTVSQITVKGVDGKKPLKTDQWVAKITDSINNAKDLKENVSFDVTKFKTKKIEVDESKWIEYNKSNFCTYLHTGDEVKELTCNTADGKEETPTITGKFRVYSKVPEQCMPNPPSESPLCHIHWVTFWGNGGYAFHEAWWLRKSNEKTGLSHGCVNMYIDDAKKVYDFAQIGTRVEVHE